MFDYLFRETTTGLKRNGLVAFAAISTTFIALLLFGLALMVIVVFRPQGILPPRRTRRAIKAQHEIEILEGEGNV